MGIYQDNGPWKNNPVALVNPEIKVIALLTEEPFIVSVDTGTAVNPFAGETSAGTGSFEVVVRS